jgi:hypothetical protein
VSESIRVPAVARVNRQKAVNATNPSELEEDLDQEGEANCTCDHSGTIDCCMKLEEEHGLEFKLKGTECLDCKEPYDTGNIIASRKKPVIFCEGYMKCKPIRCRKSIYGKCTTARMSQQETSDDGEIHRGRPSRKRRARDQLLLVTYSCCSG